MDRVHGAYAEYVAVPANQVRAIPDRVSDDRAVWAEPLANLVHCFRISMNEVPQSMAVLGAGTIGALGIMLGKMRGIRRIVAVDKNEARLNAAREIGADEVVSADDPVAAEKVGMADYVLEAVGVSAMRRLALGVCRRGGRMGFLGLAENETSLPFNEMIRNEQALFTSFAYTPKDFAESVRVIESGQKMLEKWMETRPLAEGQEAFMKMTHDPGATLKLVLQVGEMK
jgi:threonine dehydrogenase-like Zn-dependent dehydrogenase